MGSFLISWTSNKQNFISQSSTQAEFCALAHTDVEIMWIKKLYVELKNDLANPPLIFCDNVSM